VAASHGVDRDRRRQNPSQREDRPQAAARLGPPPELQRDADYAYRRWNLPREGWIRLSRGGMVIIRTLHLRFVSSYLSGNHRGPVISPI
jgi:hypothetical protein